MGITQRAYVSNYWFFVVPEVVGRTGPLLALFPFVCFIGAVGVFIADPYSRYALAVAATELVGGTSRRRAIELVLTEWTVQLLVAALVRRDATRRDSIVTRTTELRLKAGVIVTFVVFVRTVAAVVDAVAEEGRMDALLVGALVLTRHATERTAVLGFVAA